MGTRGGSENAETNMLTCAPSCIDIGDDDPGCVKLWNRLDKGGRDSGLDKAEQMVEKVKTDGSKNVWES